MAFFYLKLQKYSFLSLILVIPLILCSNSFAGELEELSVELRKLTLENAQK